MADRVKDTEDTRTAESGRKLAVLFPGIGYHCDKPLLYYAGKLAAAHGYEIIRISYQDLPGRIMGNDEKKRAAALLAREQARKQLADVNWQAYEDIVFIGKSIGTVIAGMVRQQAQVPCRTICYTPLKETFLYAGGEAIVFHGTADPWEPDDAAVREGCRRAGQMLYTCPDGNHSLETGDILRDLAYLHEVMELTDRWLR